MAAERLLYSRSWRADCELYCPAVAKLVAATVKAIVVSIVFMMFPGTAAKLRRLIQEDRLHHVNKISAYIPNRGQAPSSRSEAN